MPSKSIGLRFSLITSLILSLVGLSLFPAPAQASISLPGTTSWTSAGLQEMVRLTGRLKTSVDGLGTTTGTGNIQVEKPSPNAAVVGAFFTLVGTWNTGSLAAPTDVQLNSQTVSFSHKANNANVTNFFADVTSLVKSTIDATGSGIIDIPVNEGGSQNRYDGSELVVVFDDPNTNWGSVVIVFGTSNTAGDSFSLGFPALNANELVGHRMSIGIGFGFQGAAGSAQSSTIDISTSAVTSFSRLAEFAGSYDDGSAANGALITVGGVGDSASNPVIGAAFVEPADDEFYTLDSFLSLGDTALTIKTRNPSNDDNLFQAVFIFDRIELSGATTVSDPSVSAQVGAPVQNRNAPNPNVSSSPSTSSPQAPSTPAAQEKPYEGPIMVSFSSRIVTPGAAIEVEGKKLHDIDTISIDGQTIKFEKLANGNLKLFLPSSLSLGQKNFNLKTSYENQEHVNAIELVAKAKAQEINLLSPKSTVDASWMKSVLKRMNAARFSYNKIHCIVNSPNAERSESLTREFCDKLSTGRFAGVPITKEARSSAEFTKGFWVRVFLGWQN